MVNVQQQEMRRNELNPTVTDSKGPRPGDKRTVKGGGARPVPPEQVSSYGRPERPVAEPGERGRQRRR